jgi:hypothetical protein
MLCFVLVCFFVCTQWSEEDKELLLLYTDGTVEVVSGGAYDDMLANGHLQDVDGKTISATGTAGTGCALKQYLAPMTVVPADPSILLFACSTSMRRVCCSHCHVLTFYACRHTYSKSASLTARKRLRLHAHRCTVTVTN